MGAFGVTRSMPLQKALNLVIDRDPPPQALGAAAPGGGTLFLVPWRGRTLAGTWLLPGAVPATDAGASERDLVRTIEAVNAAFPLARVTSDRVRLLHRGLVPAVERGGSHVVMRTAPEIVDHGRDGARGLVSMVGVKYTTARAVAERAIDLVCAMLGRRASPCRTAVSPLPGTDMPAAEALLQSPPLLDSAVERAIRDEMALTLTDVVLRRTAIGSTGFPGNEVADRCARAAQRVLGWDEGRVQREIEDLKRFYAPVKL